ncbi:MAG: hypothetical protein UY52_C0009G0009 [Parcubacteria group bacterium GW2011_GWC2_49_9]|nr:MAG: hypothetical protein UY34_C0001G0008 [Parcubacteria group bacterium GW2011_GWA2_48_9]KKW16149.1 MAG: hypothetical protein UY52_C0009G0009 [Parcubacteria group bacterium GW2011_GWC2_49_9]
MRQKRIAFSAMPFGRKLLSRVNLMVFFVICSVTVYFAFFVNTNFIQTVFIPKEIPESDINARAVVIDKNLFETLLTTYTNKTSEKGTVSSVRNIFSR